jgi:hypothetical protein
MKVQEINKRRLIVHAGGGPGSYDALKMRSAKNHRTKSS